MKVSARGVAEKSTKEKGIKLKKKEANFDLGDELECENMYETEHATTHEDI